MLRILRWRNWFNNQRKQTTSTEGSNAERMYVSDEMAFSLEFRQADSSFERATLAPWVNQVVILCESDGTPVSFSIDGAAS